MKTDVAEAVVRLPGRAVEVSPCYGTLFRSRSSVRIFGGAWSFLGSTWLLDAQKEAKLAAAQVRRRAFGKARRRLDDFPWLKPAPGAGSIYSDLVDPVVGHCVRAPRRGLFSEDDLRDLKIPAASDLRP